MEIPEIPDECIPLYRTYNILAVKIQYADMVLKCFTFECGH